jgi:two-component system, NtrC family, response regulator AtoC
MAAPKPIIAELPPEVVIYGSSESMREVRLKMDRIADAVVPVLIRGESGTGKEIIAKLLHQRSSRRSGPFVKINCPAIPSTLVESELFGYEKGAFTGADVRKLGLVELANGGTLFLDEIAELDIGLQSKLLQLLQDGQFYAIGAKKEKQVEVRFICATNRILEREIQAGTFRQDLFYRIKVVSLTLPPLRNRRCDIPLLIEHFLHCYSQQFSRRLRPFSAKTMAALEDYSWPGNIRELENLVKSYVILGSEDAIRLELLQGENGGNSNGNGNGNGNASDAHPTSLKAAVRDLENRLILCTLEQQQWNRRRAAKALKISYRSLLYRLKQSDGALKQRLQASVHANND